MARSEHYANEALHDTATNTARHPLAPTGRPARVYKAPKRSLLARLFSFL